MMFWYTTVLPALRPLELTQSMQSAFVVEDTCLLAAGVTLEVLAAETQGWPASLFGYGNYEKHGERLSWHGTKGLYVTAPWCREMTIVLENMRPENFAHFDMWLKKRNSSNVVPGIHLCKPLCGYGHRMSLTSRQGPVFGGAWLPTAIQVGIPSAASQDMDEEALMGSPLAVIQWVQLCRLLRPNIKRGQPAPCVLTLPEIDVAAFQRIGIYEMTHEWFRRATLGLASTGGMESVVTARDVQLLQEIPMVTRIFQKPPPVYQEDPSAIKNLDEVWSIVQWQEGAVTRERFGDLPALRPDAVYLAQQRFRDTEKSDLPLCPRLAAFVKNARERQVGREAVALACMIECDAASFSPKKGYFGRRP
jgi:hypothetical protein